MKILLYENNTSKTPFPFIKRENEFFLGEFKNLKEMLFFVEPDEVQHNLLMKIIKEKKDSIFTYKNINYYFTIE